MTCSNCNRWFHKHCLNMPTLLYEPLEQTDISWYWYCCGLLNFNTSLFEDFELPSSACSTPGHFFLFLSVNTECNNIDSQELPSSLAQQRKARFPWKRHVYWWLTFRAYVPREKVFGQCWSTSMRKPSLQAKHGSTPPLQKKRYCLPITNL